MLREAVDLLQGLGSKVHSANMPLVFSIFDFVVRVTTTTMILTRTSALLVLATSMVARSFELTGSSCIPSFNAERSATRCGRTNPMDSPSNLSLAHSRFSEAKLPPPRELNQGSSTIDLPLARFDSFRQQHMETTRGGRPGVVRVGRDIHGRLFGSSVQAARTELLNR